MDRFLVSSFFVELDQNFVAIGLMHKGICTCSAYRSRRKFVIYLMFVVCFKVWNQNGET